MSTDTDIDTDADTRAGTETRTPGDAGPAEGRTARPWQLVAKRELLVKLTDKTFLISTVGMIAVIVVALAAQAFAASRTHTFDLAATPDAATMARAVAQDAPRVDDKAEVRVVDAADADAARALVRDGTADAWLEATGDGYRITALRSVDGQLESVTSQVVRQQVLGQRAAAAGTTVAELQRGSTLDTAQLEGDAQRSELAKGLGFAMSFLFYLAALLFGITLAQSVVEEKQSRIVEIIVTAIPVPQLLAGKIVGNALLALGQMLAFVLVGVVGLSFTDYASLLPSVSLGIGWFLLFFVVGFTLIATMFAVAGALSSRTEDVQASATPVTTLVMLTFFAALLVTGPARVVLSFVPPTSALLMPVRVVAGETHWWEPLLALVLLVAAAALVVRLAARLYRRSLLQTSGRLTLRQAWTAET